MKVVKSFQHDALTRQCAEAVWIKNVDPRKRINNKKEYHQPGDVEVQYEKNENEEWKKKKIKNSKDSQKKVIIAEEKSTKKNIDLENDKEKVPEQSVMDFIKKVRF